MKAEWIRALSDRAREYWTDERTLALTGGKQLAVLPADGAPLLRALGLMRDDASMPPDRVRKYLQINHLVRLLRHDLAGVRTVLDAGCGRSYLTLLLAHLGYVVRGIDRDPDRIAECRRRADIAGLPAVYEVGDVATAAGADAVVALHACDTATCDAIAVGVACGAKLIAVAPCCQAELARKWAAHPGGPFAPVHRAGHLRRELAAHVTDAMRMLILRGAGYAVTADELVESGHSPKNTLLRAVRAAPDPAARAEYDALVDATGGAGLDLAARVSASGVSPSL